MKHHYTTYQKVVGVVYAITFVAALVVLTLDLSVWRSDVHVSPSAGQPAHLFPPRRSSK